MITGNRKERAVTGFPSDLRTSIRRCSQAQVVDLLPQARTHKIASTIQFIHINESVCVTCWFFQSINRRVNSGRRTRKHKNQTFLFQKHFDHVSHAEGVTRAVGIDYRHTIRPNSAKRVNLARCNFSIIIVT